MATSPWLRWIVRTRRCSGAKYRAKGISQSGDWNGVDSPASQRAGHWGSSASSSAMVRRTRDSSSNDREMGVGAPALETAPRASDAGIALQILVSHALDGETLYSSGATFGRINLVRALDCFGHFFDRVDEES